MIMTFAKTKLLAIVTKVNIKDVLNMTSKTVDKLASPVKQVKTIKTELTADLKKCKKKKEPKWQSWFPFSFCFGGGKFQPLYFMVTLFCFLAASMLYVKIHAASVAVKAGTFNSDMISTADLGVVLGFISSLILLYNSNRKSYQKVDVKTEDEGDAN